jgi:FkbM family methyltransferase|tara:strand:+ start:1400 stop:2098 length:699 start_codon:yes stop_codon:yes gene_type:complete
MKIIPKILDYIHQKYHLKKIEKYIYKHFNSGIDIIFDVGCYKGHFIEICVNIYKSNFKIYAFEAENKIYEKLNHYNSCKNINIYNFGISDKDTLLDLNISYQEGTSTFSSLNHNSKYLNFKSNILGEKIFLKKEKVAVQKIDSFCLKNDIKKIDLLKIDTEGHEISVLLGAEKLIKNIKIILLEFSNHDMYLNYDNTKIDNFLIKNNFKFVKYFKTPFQKWEDRIYINKKFY